MEAGFSSFLTSPVFVVPWYGFGLHWTEFLYEYAIGFVFGWFIFQLSAMHNMGNSLAASIWKGGRAEFLSMITLMLEHGMS